MAVDQSRWSIPPLSAESQSSSWKWLVWFEPVWSRCSHTGVRCWYPHWCQHQGHHWTDVCLWGGSRCRLEASSSLHIQTLCTLPLSISCCRAKHQETRMSDSQKTWVFFHVLSHHAVSHRTHNDCLCVWSWVWGQSVKDARERFSAWKHMGLFWFACQAYWTSITADACWLCVYVHICCCHWQLVKNLVTVVWWVSGDHQTGNKYIYMYFKIHWHKTKWSKVLKLPYCIAWNFRVVFD